MHSLKSKKADYSLIVELIEEGSKVLDLGCGDGELLQYLIENKNINGRGVDIDQANIIACIERGLTVCQLNLDEGLQDFQDHFFDYVILNQTIQVVHKPHLVIKEMLRVGRKAIVSFPNFGNYKLAAYLLLHGKMPISKVLPFSWYETPNIHLLTIKDFQQFCKERNIRILKEIYIRSNAFQRTTSLVARFPNYLADEAIFVLSSN